VIRRHKKLAALLLAGWFAVSMWNPQVGAWVMTAVIGLLGLRFLACGYRRVYRWVR
jgi:hypothetical protein